MCVCGQITMIKVINTSTHLKYVLYLLMMLFWLSLHANGGHRKTTCSITSCFSLPRQGLSVNLALSQQLVSHLSPPPTVLRLQVYMTMPCLLHGFRVFELRSSCMCNKCSYPLGHLSSLQLLFSVLSFYPVTTLILSQAQNFLYHILSEVLYKRLCLLHPFQARRL